MKIEKKILVCMLFLIAILLFGKLILAEYVRAVPANLNLQSGGVAYGAFGSLNEEQCKKNLGQDFIIQVAPFGCSPAIVRSDLLEEQDVPVFCQLLATKINPLIDIQAIKDITFSGSRPDSVRDIAFFPSKAALGSSPQALNSPILNNIGYAVIAVKQQKNESAMPDFVEGKVLAKLTYDVKNAFGVGKTSFYLSEIKDEKEWQSKKDVYSFWNGKGSVRADAIYVDRALVSIYLGDRKLSSVDLTKGQESPLIYLPGMDCSAGFKVKLQSLDVPGRRVRLDINGEVVEVVEGEQFLGGACTVKDIVKNGVNEKVDIQCTDNPSFSLALSPKISLSYKDGEKDQAGIYAVGDKLPFKDGNSCIYLGYVGTGKNSQKEENLYARFIKTPDCAKNALDESSISEVSRFDNTNIVSAGFERAVRYFVQGTQITDQIKIGTTGKVFVQDVKVLGFAEPVDVTLNAQIKGNYDKALSDFDAVLASYADTKYPAEEKATKGEQTFVEKIKLADSLGQKRSVVEFCKSFKEQYPGSGKLQDVAILCDDKFKLSSSSASSNSVSVNGVVKEISFEGIYDPSTDEYGAEVDIINTENDSYSKLVTLGLNDQAFVNESEYIALKSISDNYVDFDVSGVKGESGTLRVALNEKKAIGEKKAYQIRVNKINLKKVAKVSINPNINFVNTEANFTFKIGIEKRSIKLSPDQITKKLDILNSTIADLQKTVDRLGNVVKGMKAACLGTGTFLTIKNLLANKDGKAIARQEVMRGGVNGWYQKCSDLVKQNKAEYPTIDNCLLKNSDQINKEVNDYYTLLGNVNDGVKKLEEPCQDTDLFGQKVVNDNCFSKAYLSAIKERIRTSSTSRYGENIILPSGKSIPVNDFVNNLDVSKVSIDDLRSLDLYSRVSKDSSLNEMIDQRFKTKIEDIYQTTFATNEISSLSKEFKDAGYNDADISWVVDKNAVQEGYNGWKISKTDILGENSYFEEGKSYNAKIQGYGDKTYLFILDSGDGSTYGVVKAFKFEGFEQKKIKISELVTSAPSEDVSRKFVYTKYDSSTYSNHYLRSFGENEPLLKYYETEPYKGEPAIVPFDLKQGWYVSIQQTLPVTGNIRAYDASGRVNSFYICNVGKDETEQNRGGDDICQFFVNGQNYGRFNGLSSAETATLIDDATEAVRVAQNSYSTAKQGQKVRIKTNRGTFDVKVGAPAVDLPDIKCQDVYSPKECQLLFNVCDPVMCPSSRCDLGGAYPVKDVIQSGVVGSALLCLPNIKEGIIIPVCLSGIQAGLDTWLTVQKSYQQCLQQNLATGETIGICDEIYSLYQCEFFWRQGIPLAKVAAPKIIEAILGQNIRGGGEYLGFQSAWDSAGKSVDYFTQYYAQNSFQAFKARSTEEFGGEVCKLFVSAAYPSSGNFLDQLTEPDSPSQFYGRFDEIPFTTATNPPVSQYKVFFHIYAGNDRGAYYKVYLKGGSGSSFYQDTSTSRLVEQGYIAKGDFKTDSPDFTAPSGYTQLCISVNEQVECGFKEVSTDFSVQYIKDKYIAEQANQTNIKTQKDCVAGTASLYSALNPNLEEGASAVINPAIYNNGLTRICATNCPSQNVESCTGESAQWVPVGYCDDPKIKCWLDTTNVADLIKNANIESSVLQNQNAEAQKQLLSGTDYFADDSQLDAKLTSSLTGTTQEKINNLTEILTKAYFNRHKGEIHYERGILYGNLSQVDYKKMIAELLKSQITTPSPLEDDESEIQKILSKLDKEIFDYVSPSFEFEDSTGAANIYYAYNKENWLWSFDGKKWATLYQEYLGVHSDAVGQLVNKAPEGKDLTFIRSLKTKGYSSGLDMLMKRTIADDEGRGFWASIFGGHAELITNKVVFSKDGRFKISLGQVELTTNAGGDTAPSPAKTAEAILYLRFENGWKWQAYLNGNSLDVERSVSDFRNVLDFDERVKNLIGKLNSLTGASAYPSGAKLIFELNSPAVFESITGKQPEVVETGGGTTSGGGTTGGAEEKLNCKYMKLGIFLSIEYTPCIGEQGINELISGTPLEGNTQLLLNLGKQHNIDPLFALAFFQRETNFGRSDIAMSAHNPGNVKYSSACPDEYTDSAGVSWCKYGSWEEGIRGWFEYIDRVYVGKGLDTVETIIPVYAPKTDKNDPISYIRGTRNFVLSNMMYTSFTMKTGDKSGDYDENQLSDTDPSLKEFVDCLSGEYGGYKPIVINSFTDTGLYTSPPTCNLNDPNEIYNNDAYCVHTKNSCHYHQENGVLSSRAVDISSRGMDLNKLKIAFDTCNYRLSAQAFWNPELANAHVHISIKACDSGYNGD